MLTFTYRALAKSGEIVRGELTAPDKNEVTTRIEYLGLLPVEIKAHIGSSASLLEHFNRDIQWSQLLKAKPNADDITSFARDFATLLKAGVRIEQSLALLSDKELTGALSGSVSKLHDGVSSGETLADCMARQRDLFPPVFVALVRIGETSGSLPSVLGALADERIRMSGMRRKAIASLRYPAFILCAAVVVLFFFLLFVIPQFASVLQDLGPRMDPIVRLQIWLSEAVLTNKVPLLFTGFLFAMMIGFVAVSRPARQRLTDWGLRLPVLRNLSMDYRTAVFCRSLGVLLGNGVRLTSALSMVTEAVADERSANRWKTARERVRQGGRLGDALSEVGALSPVALRMLRIGEEAGQLAPVSIRAADLIELRLERRLDKLIAIIGPAAILFISLIVGGLVVSLMTSLVSLGQLAN